MNYGNFIKYDHNVFRSNTLSKAALLVALQGVILAAPWEQENLYQLFCASFEWDCLMIGPVMSMALLLSVIIKIFRSENIAVYHKNRTKILFHIITLCIHLSLIVSLWLNSFILIIGKFLYNIKFATENMSTYYGMNDGISIFCIYLRTYMMMWIFLFILGLLYMIVYFWSKKRIFSILSMFLIIGIEKVAEFYSGRQLFMNDIFPRETCLYLTWDGFGMGMSYLFFLLLILSSLLYMAVMWKEFF